MKYLATLTILLFLISSNEILQAQWIQTNGPYGGIVNCLAVSGTNLFAGTDNGVFLSTNNESSWTAVNNGFPSNPQIVALTDSGTNIFAGIKDRVYFSTNNGTNWRRQRPESGSRGGRRGGQNVGDQGHPGRPAGSSAAGVAAIRRLPRLAGGGGQRHPAGHHGG